MTTDTTPRSPLFKRLDDLEHTMEEIMGLQRKMLDTVGRICNRRQQRVVGRTVNDEEIAIERDTDGEYWLQIGQQGTEISVEEYERWLRMGDHDQTVPTVVEQLGKRDLWQAAFDAETEHLRAQCVWSVG